MKHPLSSSMLLLLLCSISGCRAYQLQNDQNQIRQAVLEMHTEQIVDNLVRLQQGLPFVHLDYIHMTGTVTHNATGNVSGGQTIVNTSNSAAKGIVPASTFIAFGHGITTAFGYGASGGQTNQLTITAEPVTNSPDVYNAYLNFLEKPEHLVCTDCPPDCGEAIVVKCYESPCGTCDWLGRPRMSKMYYWVPSVYRTEFQTLCMHTVAIRGDLGAAISTFDVTILGLDAIPDCLPPAAAEGDAAGKRICYEEVTEGQLHLRIKIDKKIPNDTGYIEATIGGHVITGKDVLMLTPNTDTAPAEAGRPVSEKQKTDVLDLRLSLADIGLVSKDADDDSKEVKDAVARVEKDLQGQKVKIHLRSFIPTGSQTDVLLEGLRTQLELSRLGQMQ